MRKKDKDMQVSVPPATMAELAERLGVSASLVSKALAGDAKVAAKTRERIQAAAREMGYRRNPTASLLAKRRHSGRAQEGRLSVALLTGGDEESFGAVCGEAGVDGVLCHPAAGDSPRRLLDQLWNRGVDGLLLNPQKLPWTEASLRGLAWDRFPVVKLARIFPELPFHLVRHDAFDFALLTLRKACAAPARRVCVLLWESGSEIDNLARMGALLAFESRELPQGVELMWRQWEGPLDVEDACAREWLLRAKPDTVVLFHFSMLYTLEQAGLPAAFRPRCFSFLHSPGFSLLDRPLAGCDNSRRDYLRRSLGLLLELIGRGERGFVPFPTEHVIEPVWVATSRRSTGPG